MYIGPWQEYNLSKRKQKEENKSSLQPAANNVDRFAIEKALTDKLDPLTAKQAIDAILPILAASKEPPILLPPSIKGSELAQLNRSKHLHVHTNRQRDPTILPSIGAHKMISESGSNTPSTPNSFRSSVSEPAPRADVGGGVGATKPSFHRHRIARKREKFSDGSSDVQRNKSRSINSNNNSNHNISNRVDDVGSKSAHQGPISVPGQYNADDVMLLLKMERQQRNQPDFQQFWHWQGKKNSNEDPKKQPDQVKVGRSDPEARMSQKLEQVNRMYMMYSSKAKMNDSDSENEGPTKVDSHSSSKGGGTISTNKAQPSSTTVQGIAISSNYLISESEMPGSFKGPQISDMELTDAHFRAIGKYFQCQEQLQESAAGEDEVEDSLEEKRRERQASQLPQLQSGHGSRNDPIVCDHSIEDGVSEDVFRLPNVSVQSRLPPSYRGHGLPPSKPSFEARGSSKDVISASALEVERPAMSAGWDDLYMGTSGNGGGGSSLLDWSRSLDPSNI